MRPSASLSEDIQRDSLRDLPVPIEPEREGSLFSSHEFVDPQALGEFAHPRKDLAGRRIVAVGQA
jgi:hypothetical protein